MITGQKPIRKSKQGSFQIVDIVENMRPITKVSHRNYSYVIDVLTLAID